MSAGGGLARELAPSGRLRAAINLGNPVLAHRREDGALTGVTIDLARTLASDLGVEVDLIPYDSGGAVTRDVTCWDIAFLADAPERAGEIRFTAPYLVIDGACLVPADAPTTSFADLDRPGARIAVGDGAAYHHILARILKHAELVTAPTSAQAITLFQQAGLEAAAGVRQTLELAAARMPSLVRVLSDNFSSIHQAVALPRGRSEDAFARVSGFVEARRRDGSIEAWLARDGQRSVTVLQP